MALFGLGLGSRRFLFLAAVRINSVKPIPVASTHLSSERLPHVHSRGTGFGDQSSFVLDIRKIENVYWRHI
jgi:hypothetical protein